MAVATILVMWVLLLKALNGTKLSSYTSIPKCSVVYQQLWCAGVGLLHVPVENHKPPNVTTYIDISQNKIAKITWEMQLYPDLEYLTVENNSLSQIHPDAFRHLWNLQELNLAGNKITGGILHDNMFRSQQNLRILDISRNYIGPVLQFDIFRYLTSLTYLSLAYNNIISVSGIAEHQPEFVLHSLTELNWYNNYMEDIPSQIWSFIPNLILLDISRNSFISIPTNAFEGLTQLRSLFITRNDRLCQIQDGAFSSLQKLETLHLNNCHYLRQINEHAFDGCGNLKYVDFSNNNLLLLQETLLPLDKLQTLLLEHNNLTCNCSLNWILYSSKMKSLLSGQSITCIDPRNARICDALDHTTFLGCKLHQHQSEHTHEKSLLIGVCTLITTVMIIAVFVLYHIEKRKNRDMKPYRTHQYWALH